MEKSRKILIFSTAYYPFVGGAEVAIKEITDRLKGDFEFDLITAKMDSNLPTIEKIGNVLVHRVGLGYKTFDKLWLALFGSKKASKLHKEKKYDLAWSMMASQASIATAKFKIKNPEVKLVLTMQEGDEEEHLKRYAFDSDFLYQLFIRPLHLLVFKKADFGTAISNYLIERMRKNGMTVPIKLIPNGVDIKSFKLEAFSLEERRKIRAELGLKEKDVALITTSRLVAKNGVGDAIEALKFLPENIKFVILGDGELKEKLQKLAKDIGVSKMVIFKGYVSHNEIPKYLKACDIFVRASLSEGMGNSFLEAMAAKLPVIGTPVGGIVDFLYDPSFQAGTDQTGYFCKPGNPQSVAEAVKRVISDENKSQVIENAYNMVLEKYDWGLIAKRTKEFFCKFDIFS